MPQTNRPVLATVRSRAWKIIRPILVAVDWLLVTVLGPPKRRPEDADIEAARYETEARIGRYPPPGGGMGPPL